MVFLILWYIYKIWKLKLKFQKHLSWWIFIHLVTIKFKTAHSIPTWGFLACIRMFEANRLQKGAFFFSYLYSRVSWQWMKLTGWPKWTKILASRFIYSRVGFWLWFSIWQPHTHICQKKSDGGKAGRTEEGWKFCFRCCWLKRGPCYVFLKAPVAHWTYFPLEFFLASRQRPLPPFLKNALVHFQSEVVIILWTTDAYISIWEKIFTRKKTWAYKLEVNTLNPS